jgi:hypothetical protein
METKDIGGLQPLLLWVAASLPHNCSPAHGATRWGQRTASRGASWAAAHLQHVDSRAEQAPILGLLLLLSCWLLLLLPLLPLLHPAARPLRLPHRRGMHGMH